MRAHTKIIRYLMFLTLIVLFSYNLTSDIFAQGNPSINKVSPNIVSLVGGMEVTLQGNNFTADSQIFVGEVKVTKIVSINNTEIHFLLPPQRFPGVRAISVKNQLGLAQNEITVMSKSLNQLSAGQITTIAGGITGLGDGKLAANVSLIPSGVAVDSNNNIYTIDIFNSRIRRIDNGTKIITTIAGNGIFESTNENLPSFATSLSFPNRIVSDKAGNLYVLDLFAVYKIDPNANSLKFIVGLGAGFQEGEPGRDVSLNNPSDLAVDSAGNLYIADEGFIRVVDAKTNIIRTLATSFDGFVGLTVDKMDNLIVADPNSNTIIQLDPRANKITPIAGIKGKSGFSGDGDLATKALLSGPFAIKVDSANNIYFADYNNNRIRRIERSTGIISTIAGKGDFFFTGIGKSALETNFSPSDLTLDAQDNLLITDFLNDYLFKVELKTQQFQIISGNGSTDFNGDNIPALTTNLARPRSIKADAQGNLYLTDINNNRIRRIDAVTGIITTVAGNNQIGFSGDNVVATTTSLNNPAGIAIDRMGNLYIADTGNHRVRRVDATTGIITTIAGTGQIGFSGNGGPALQAKLTDPFNLTLDQQGNLLILESFTNTIRKVDFSTGIITTIAGGCSSCSLGDGGLATNASLRFRDSFSNVGGDVLVDAAGNMVVADFGNRRIRLIDSNTSIISTIAGTSNNSSGGDGGPASMAVLSGPKQLTSDKNNNLYITDGDSLRRIDAATKTIGTVAGFSSRYLGDGQNVGEAIFSNPDGLTVDGQDNLYIVDSANTAIRVVKAISNLPKLIPDLVLITDGELVFPLNTRGTQLNARAFIKRINGFADMVNLSATISPATDTISMNFSSSSLKSNETVSTLNINVTDKTPARTYTITITANAGSITHKREIPLVVNSSVPASDLQITNAVFKKPNLVITGSGFSSLGAVVTVNGQNVSQAITTQSDTTINLKANKKKLNLKKGSNQVSVTVNGAVSNTFTFTL